MKDRSLSKKEMKWIMVKTKLALRDLGFKPLNKILNFEASFFIIFSFIYFQFYLISINKLWINIISPA